MEEDAVTGLCVRLSVVSASSVDSDDYGVDVCFRFVVVMVTFLGRAREESPPLSAPARLEGVPGAVPGDQSLVRAIKSVGAGESGVKMTRAGHDDRRCG